MRRRRFISMLGGFALGAPLLARAQPTAKPAVGFLIPFARSPEEIARFIQALRRGLLESGFADGSNVSIELHTAGGRLERLPDVAAEMVRKRMAVLFSPSNVGARALKAATSEIPIVFVVGLDPVEMGLVTGIDRPGTNATGVAFGVSALEPKRMELLVELVPNLRLVAALVNPRNPNAQTHVQNLQTAAANVGLGLFVLNASDPEQIDAAFTSLVQRRAGALLVTSDPLFDRERERLAGLADRHKLPAIYPWRDFTDVGGLLSYGNDLMDAVRQAGVYVGRILKGAQPRDLPVWVPTKFDLVINLKAAKAQAIVIPPMLLARADEVIE